MQKNKYSDIPVDNKIVIPVKKIILQLVICFVICFSGCSQKADIDSADSSGMTLSAQPTGQYENQTQPMPQSEVSQTPVPALTPDTPELSNKVSQTPAPTSTPDTPELSNKVSQTPVPTSTPDTPKVSHKVSQTPKTTTKPTSKNQGVSYKEAKVIVSGKEITFDGQQAIIKDGDVLIPVYGVFEKLEGANGNKSAPFTVKWDETASVATIRNSWYTVTATAGEETITCNGKTITPAVPPQTIDGVFMLPLRAVAKAIDATVDWDETAATISIFYEAKIRTK